MAAHLGGVTREMSADSFASSLSDAIHAGGGSKPTAVPLLVEAGAAGEVRLASAEDAAGGSAACPSGVPPGAALVREMLPAQAEQHPSIGPRDEIVDSVALLYERRVEASELGWAADEPQRLGSEPMPPRRTLDLVPPMDTWDVWRTPAEREGGGSSGAPEFVEVMIDDDMLAVGAESSSLRRIPAGKEFQLKGSSQNTPFRPGGFEALTGIDLSDPAQAAAQTA